MITYTNHGGGTHTQTFDGVTIYTGCTIVDVPNPTNPSEPDYTLTYTLYEPTLTIDLTNIAWTQSPPCDYPATNSGAWTNPEPNVVYVSPFSDFMLSVSTLDKTKLGPISLTLVNTVEYGGESWTPEITFDVTIVDPCDATVWVAGSIPTLSTLNGVPAEVTFDDIQDSVEVAKGINTLCGPRSYVITYQNDDPIDWVTVAQSADDEHVLVISADPTLDEHEGTKNLKAIVTLDYYPDIAAHETNFDVVISTPPCDCSLITYDIPSEQTLTTTVKIIPPDTLPISHATQNADSLIASPAIRACLGTCGTSTTIASIVDKETGLMPDFMTLDTSTGTLTIDAQDNTLIGIYEMQVTMTTEDSGDQVYETVTITLDYCVITHLDPPDTPSLLEYKVFAIDDVVLDLSTPGFQQVPACGYYLVEQIYWDIPTEAPIV